MNKLPTGGTFLHFFQDNFYGRWYIQDTFLGVVGFTVFQNERLYKHSKFCKEMFTLKTCQFKKRIIRLNLILDSGKFFILVKYINRITYSAGIHEEKSPCSAPNHDAHIVTCTEQNLGNIRTNPWKFNKLSSYGQKATLRINDFFIFIFYYFYWPEFLYHLSLSRCM